MPRGWLAGTVTDLTAQVGAAAAAGTMAGAVLDADLVEDDVQARPVLAG